MRRLINIFTFVILISKSYSQNYNSAVSDSIIQNFMNWEIDNSLKYAEDQRLWKKRIEKRIIPWQEALIDHIGSAGWPNTFENQFEQIKSKSFVGFKELINQNDITFFKFQFESKKEDNWNIRPSKGNIKKSKTKYYSYTTPLFNETYTIAILYKEFYCGTLCAYGNLNFYKKENGKWSLYRSIQCWVS